MIKTEKDWEADAALRAALNELCKGAGFDFTEANLITDLAMNGVDSAFEAIVRVANSAPPDMRNVVLFVSMQAFALTSEAFSKMPIDVLKSGFQN